MFALNFFLNSKLLKKDMLNPNYKFYYYKSNKIFYNTSLNKKTKVFKKSIFFKNYGFK
jgi:hypothetical protein